MWKKKEPPADFECPLTLEVMVDPVVLQTEAGRSYERKALEAHLCRHPNFDPAAGILSKHRPTLTLKSMIDDWRRREKRPGCFSYVLARILRWVTPPDKGARPRRKNKLPVVACPMAEKKDESEAVATHAVVERLNSGDCDLNHGPFGQRDGRQRASLPLERQRERPRRHRERQRFKAPRRGPR